MSHKIKLTLTLLIIFISMTAESAFPYWIWTPQTKKWVNPKHAPRDTPKEQLLYAMDFFEAENYSKALVEFQKIINYYKRSESASEAQYFIGRCHEELDKPYKAFEAYQKVIEDYPFTQRTDEIIEREFNIGERLYQGEKTKFLGVSFKVMPEEIIQVYKKVVFNAPYSKYAPKAQLKIGELYKKIGLYEDAKSSYEKIMEDYPDSDVSAEAKYQAALCASLASGKSGYDQKQTTEAIKEFEEFAKQNPDSELVQKAKDEKRQLMEKKAASYFGTAKFYENVGKYESASIYYNKILEEVPESSLLPSALERLKIVDKRLNRNKKKG